MYSVQTVPSAQVHVQRWHVPATYCSQQGETPACKININVYSIYSISRKKLLNRARSAHAHNKTQPLTHTRVQAQPHNTHNTHTHTYSTVLYYYTYTRARMHTRLERNTRRVRPLHRGQGVKGKYMELRMAEVTQWEQAVQVLESFVWMWEVWANPRSRSRHTAPQRGDDNRYMYVVLFKSTAHDCIRTLQVCCIATPNIWTLLYTVL